MRLADPKPGYCSLCCNSGGPDSKFVDTEASWDGAIIIDPQTGTPALWSDGAPSASENVFICEACAAEVTELMAARPQQHSMLARELERTRVESEHWKATARRFKKELDAQLEQSLRRPVGRPRKAVV